MKKQTVKKESSVKLLFIGGIILTLGDIVAAQWVRSGGNYLYALIIALYLIGMIYLVASYKSEDIAVASTVLIIFNIVILTIVGAWLFGETINSTKIIGIVLCFVALILLESGKRGR